MADTPLDEGSGDFAPAEWLNHWKSNRFLQDALR